MHSRLFTLRYASAYKLNASICITFVYIIHYLIERSRGAHKYTAQTLHHPATNPAITLVPRQHLTCLYQNQALRLLARVLVAMIKIDLS